MYANVNMHVNNGVYIQELRSQLQDRLQLADYLILPVSRITKCSLLLSDFRKQSARSAQPAGSVDAALRVTRGISRQANNAIHLDMLEGFSKMEVGELVLLVSLVCTTSTLCHYLLI